MKPLREYVLPFTGLKNGAHDYHFTVDEKFFQEFEYSEIEKANVQLDLILEKKELMLVLNLSFSGTVEVSCDACTAPYDLPFASEYQHYIKFGEPGSSDDESITVLAETAYEVDISQLVYELINISLPTRKVHPEGECDEELRDQIEEYLAVETEDHDDVDSDDTEDEMDPRWAALKGLKKED